MINSHDAPLLVAAFYKFVPLKDCGRLREAIDDFARARGIMGTVLIAAEGINGTVAGEPDAIDALFTYLREGNIFGGAFRDLAPKFSDASKMPFLRLKVRRKREIVTLRSPEVDPRHRVGTYISPGDWNALIAEPDVVTVDTRNIYETAIGTFEGAVDPRIDQFTDFKDFVARELAPDKNRRVAMFCTGGIRCEKASSYLLGLGFEEVYHLQGGILKYLEEVPEAESRWRGACFVFDDRVGVGHRLEKSEHELCRACRWPLTQAERAHPDFIEGVQCSHCKDSLDETTRARAIERQRQVELAKKRGEAHMGDRGRVSAEKRRKLKLAQKKKSRTRAR